MIDWDAIINQMVGKPFRWGARGPDAYDCWGAVLETLRLAGLPSPGDLDTASGDRAVFEALAAGKVMDPQWNRVDTPQPGDVVALSTHTKINHAGVYVPGGVLHMTAKRGAVLARTIMLRAAGYRLVEFYRWVG